MIIPLLILQLSYLCGNESTLSAKNVYNKLEINTLSTLAPKSTLPPFNKIQGFTGTLIISTEEAMDCPSHFARNQASFKLAKLLSEIYGINVLLTMSPWPRDHITVYGNGE